MDENLTFDSPIDAKLKYTHAHTHARTHTYCCQLTACIIWLSKFKLNLQRVERKLGEVSRPHPHL